MGTRVIDFGDESLSITNGQDDELDARIELPLLCPCMRLVPCCGTHAEFTEFGGEVLVEFDWFDGELTRYEVVS